MITAPAFETEAQSRPPDEGIVHYGAVRIRVTGSGNLRMSFLSYDQLAARTRVLTPIVMSDTPDREPRVLSNFKSQRAFLKIETTAINEIFTINRVIVFIRPLWAEYRG